ncbi:dimethyl sulfoxide reductase anchor subunit [Phaeobacter gallaeciensis]|jgi:DMSO reductase anchor subunit|uniref:dimethyl sulfoxide reductase anchor subunit family protein n=1 Tax=Phaeobacter gallaeciensis TaxID=60890 RepID=UPI00237F1BD0|nr:DmsC/YnfH family molybdoenzyme membrane anchor subunit [Phaeobacter gallaeciensis]MDE4303809.1 dimethyl sulfoxide reductase anchor subunit [Phaeobacter gallaeciensis]MDE4308868.1 dimethyl sulfoxide reductase anchor subunit [Phaeobacter gallaeciensis]MDE4313578.1 dimethyl sulfoxide reductase anchor subunit [Phaeobacter gallaeciensis]MDE4317797.1 dimethyl sulfoxide reductase anchor subunit [Phaeobacter gallaeciensis]MDE4322260.1 dimethyl sulfoxide reductase anchor subunit [Phaeobacter gallaec
MHPAPSVIIFTTLSGLGFGLLAFLGLGMPAVTGWVAFVFYLIAYALAVGGLLASTFHLGHPERAWKAFSQWRTSWLSREGCTAVAALLIMGLYAAGAVFLDADWRLLGLLGAALSIGTVFTTAMIYTQLKTIPRWHSPLTPLVFLSFAVAGGALLAGRESLAPWLLALAGAIQLIYWAKTDKALAHSGTDIGTATGLGNRGSVRAFEPPHTGSNYLLREFVYVVGRKHALKLRIIGFGLGFALPIALMVMPFDSVMMKHLMAGVAVLLHIAGIACLRWLFFAQAEHVVGLYYGKR